MSILDVNKIKRQWPKSYEYLKNKAITKNKLPKLGELDSYMDSLIDIQLSTGSGIVSLLDDEEIFVLVDNNYRGSGNEVIWFYQDAHLSPNSEEYNSREEAEIAGIEWALTQLEKRL